MPFRLSIDEIIYSGPEHHFNTELMSFDLALNI